MYGTDIPNQNSPENTALIQRNNVQMVYSNQRVKVDVIELQEEAKLWSSYLCGMHMVLGDSHGARRLTWC